MHILKTKLKDLLIIKSKVFNDKRGFFKEINQKKILNKNLIFDCLSHSKRNTIRGLHFQRTNPQGKFITVVHGEILDVVVDCRKKSKTFGKHYKIVLSEKNCKSIFIPAGFLHGFLGLEKENIVIYSCTKYRDKNSEIGIKWNDKDLNINWNIKSPILSQKDKKNLNFKEINF